MSILNGIAVLNCQSIEATLNFYQQALQFVVIKKREAEGELQWVHIMNGSTTLMLQRAGLQSLPSDKTSLPNIMLYFYVSNINEISHLLKAKYNINADVSTTAYKMLECYISDPEGNQITLGQKNVDAPDD
ncbi:hypothetical protein MNBD_GAMMA05-1435 [hydrothermal vent metagenome]|uniref:Glyoxalase/fosfomycin resistance/dioxygenase domain-containing protein n=1 Tax=hydrothermal vent metagenome TaxID=652676 RepID=A0A3B0W6K6_9ZZZZ